MDAASQDDAMLVEAEQMAASQTVDSQPESNRRAVEQLDTCFEDRHYQPYYLTRETVLDYFSRSPFYDRKCNNEVVREQNKPLESMKMMTGLEYVTYPNKHEPRLFVIIKQVRSSELAATRKALYYVLDRVVYQAPSVRHLCLRRLRSACENIQEALQFYEKNKRFSCVEGRFWSFPTDTEGLWRQGAHAVRLRIGEERQNIKKMKRIGLAIRRAMEDAETERGTDPSTTSGAHS